MADRKTKIIVIRDDGRATVYPSGIVDTDSAANTVVQDIKDLLPLSGDYELYVKVNSRTKLSSISFDAIAILPTNIKPSRSVSLG